MSSFSIALARVDMFAKMSALTSSFAPFRASADVLHVDLLQQLLDRLGVEDQQVLEDEHQLADLVRQLGVLLVQVLEDVALGGPVGVVQDVDQRLDAAGRLEVLVDQARQLALHHGSTSRSTSGAVRSIAAMRIATSVCSSCGNMPITWARAVGGQVGHHQRDRLRVLVLQEVEDLDRVDLAQELERRDAGCRSTGGP